MNTKAPPARSNLTRSEFLRAASSLACASCAGLAFGPRAASASPVPPAVPPAPSADELKAARDENQFTANWLTDLFEAIDREVDPAVQQRLLQACGRGCFRRHQFKQDLAAAGKGNADKLVEAYRMFFGIERDGDLVHIRYGDHCFCPAAHHPPKGPKDLHCECTRASHEAIFETALGRPITVELVESIRRGGQTCHLIAHLA